MTDSEIDLIKFILAARPSLFKSKFTIPETYAAHLCAQAHKELSGMVLTGLPDEVVVKYFRWIKILETTPRDPKFCQYLLDSIRLKDMQELL